MLEISPQGLSGLPGKICLCGIGAAGTKVMEEVLLLSPQPASVCAMNLDARLLNASAVPCKVHLGARLTRGLGSGGDASVGAQAACESESSILRALEGSALAVLVAGLGGGTGSGVAPEAARLAKEQGAYVVSVVIRQAVGRKRWILAYQGRNEQPAARQKTMAAPCAALCAPVSAPLGHGGQLTG